MRPRFILQCALCERVILHSWVFELDNPSPCSFGFGPAHVASVLLLALSPQVWSHRPTADIHLRLTLLQKIAQTKLLGSVHIPDVLINEVACDVERPCCHLLTFCRFNTSASNLRNWASRKIALFATNEFTCYQLFSSKRPIGEALSLVAADTAATASGWRALPACE
jgi:hypothetical protein